MPIIWHKQVITFIFAKRKYLEEAQQGFVLYNLRQDKQRQQAIIFNNLVVTPHGKVWPILSLVKSGCVYPAPLWRHGFSSMKAAIGDALVVVLQPDPDDVSRVQIDLWQRNRVVAGMINMNLLSYHTPLATEQTAREGHWHCLFGFPCDAYAR